MSARASDRSARIVAFVTDSGIRENAKARLLARLEGDEVSGEAVARIEPRMGG